jgi:hypothetical protein
MKSTSVEFVDAAKLSSLVRVGVSGNPSPSAPKPPTPMLAELFFFLETG